MIREMHLRHKIHHCWMCVFLLLLLFFVFFYSLKTIGAELQTKRTSALWFISSSLQWKLWRTHWPYTEGSPWHNSEVQGNYLRLNSAYIKWSYRRLNRDALIASHFLWLTRKCSRLLCEQGATCKNVGIIGLVHHEIQKLKKKACFTLGVIQGFGRLRCGSRHLFWWKWTINRLSAQAWVAWEAESSPVQPTTEAVMYELCMFPKAWETKPIGPSNLSFYRWNIKIMAQFTQKDFVELPETLHSVSLLYNWLIKSDHLQKVVEIYRNQPWNLRTECIIRHCAHATCLVLHFRSSLLLNLFCHFYISVIYVFAAPVFACVEFIWTLNKLDEDQFDISLLSRKNNQHCVSVRRLHRDHANHAEVYKEHWIKVPVVGKKMLSVLQHRRQSVRLNS